MATDVGESGDPVRAALRSIERGARAACCRRRWRIFRGDRGLAFRAAPRRCGPRWRHQRRSDPKCSVLVDKRYCPV